jgi:hypothetical protein
VRPRLRLPPLPLLLVAAMLAIAVALERALFGDAALLAKAPLALLLAVALWRAWRARGAA